VCLKEALAAKSASTVLADPPPPAGELLDMGGYRLHLECVGSGGVLPAEAPDIQRRSTNLLVAFASHYSQFVYADVPGVRNPRRPDAGLRAGAGR
jgi:hypothetical protein